MSSDEDRRDEALTSHLDKIKTPEALREILIDHRRDGERVVQCHGAFDHIHPGHIRHLVWAKSQGAKLVVSVQEKLEGGGPVLVDAADRAEQLAAIEVVDYVTIDGGDWIGGLLESLKPDIYVKGREFTEIHDGAFGRERRLVEAYGGEVRFSSGDVLEGRPDMLARSASKTLQSSDQLRSFLERTGLDAGGIERRIERMRDCSILVLGETIVDEYVYCDALGMSADAPTLVVRPTHDDKFVGGAGIVSQHVRGLGASSHFISVVGEDIEAEYVRLELERREVDHRLIVDPTRPTIAKKRFMAQGRKLLNVNTFRDQGIDERTEQAVLEHVEELARSVDAIVISDFSYGVVTEAVIERLTAIARERGIPIAGDVQTSSQLGRVTRLRGLTVVTPSEKEARQAMWDRENGVADVGARLLRETRHESLLVSMGSRGLMMFDSNGLRWDAKTEALPLHELKQELSIEYLPSFGDVVVDPMGAGDSMLATLTTAMAAGAPLMEAAFLGNCAAAVAIADLGNVPVSHLQVADVAKQQILMGSGDA
jgi:rfaE bifunctional protein kinase chain/domain